MKSDLISLYVQRARLNHFVLLGFSALLISSALVRNPKDYDLVYHFLKPFDAWSYDSLCESVAPMPITYHWVEMAQNDFMLAPFPPEKVLWIDGITGPELIVLPEQDLEFLYFLIDHQHTTKVKLEPWVAMGEFLIDSIHQYEKPSLQRFKVNLSPSGFYQLFRNIDTLRDFDTQTYAPRTHVTSLFSSGFQLNGKPSTDLNSVPIRWKYTHSFFGFDSLQLEVYATMTFHYQPLDILPGGYGQLITSAPLYSLLSNMRSELHGLSIAGALEYLDRKRNDEQATVDVFGAQVSHTDLRWYGILMLPGLSLYFLLHVRGLHRYLKSHSIRDELPWTALYTDKLSQITWILLQFVPLIAITNIWVHHPPQEYRIIGYGISLIATLVFLLWGWFSIQKINSHDINKP